MPQTCKILKRRLERSEGGTWGWGPEWKRATGSPGKKSKRRGSKGGSSGQNWARRAETPGRCSYPPRVQALGALLGARSRKRNEREPERILEGIVRPRALRLLRSTQRRSRSPAASCPPAGRESRLPGSSRTLAQQQLLPALGKSLEQALTGGSDRCQSHESHVRRRTRNRPNERAFPGAQRP